MSRKTRTKSKTRNNAKSRAKKATVSTVKSTDTEETVIPTAEPAIIKEEVAQPEPKEEIKIETPVEENQVIEQPDLGPRRSVVFIGSECYPFVKTGGLGDVMSALPKSLAKLNVDVKVILQGINAFLGNTKKRWNTKALSIWIFVLMEDNTM